MTCMTFFKELKESKMFVEMANSCAVISKVSMVRPQGD
jgi:hypothetical protein